MQENVNVANDGCVFNFYSSLMKIALNFMRIFLFTFADCSFINLANLASCSKLALGILCTGSAVALPTAQIVKAWPIK